MLHSLCAVWIRIVILISRKLKPSFPPHSPQYGTVTWHGGQPDLLCLKLWEVGQQASDTCTPGPSWTESVARNFGSTSADGKQEVVFPVRRSIPKHQSDKPLWRWDCNSPDHVWFIPRSMSLELNLPSMATTCSQPLPSCGAPSSLHSPFPSLCHQLTPKQILLIFTGPIPRYTPCRKEREGYYLVPVPNVN